MKTKSAFLTLVLATVLLASLPEPAYAPVGYYNVTLTSGYNFVANQLDAPPNRITNVINGTVPSGTEVWVWNVANQSYDPPVTYWEGSGWDGDVELPVGKGFVIQAPSQWTQTFVGNVPQGSLTHFIAGGNKLSLVGSKVPLSGALASVLQFPGIDGADVYLYRSASQQFTDAFSYFGGYGWYDPKKVADTNGPIVNVGESFFIQNPGPDTNWVRNFTVQALQGPAQQSLGTTTDGTHPEIQHIGIKAGQVTLVIRNPDGGTYSVQHSPDGVTWKTVATNQTAAVWEARLPDGTRGYYQVVKP